MLSHLKSETDIVAWPYCASASEKFNWLTNCIFSILPLEMYFWCYPYLAFHKSTKKPKMELYLLKNRWETLFKEYPPKFLQTSLFPPFLTQPKPGRVSEVKAVTIQVSVNITRIVHTMTNCSCYELFMNNFGSMVNCS